MKSFTLKDHIRQKIKTQRALLPSRTIKQQSLQLCTKLQSFAPVCQAFKVGFYMPFRGEIDPCYYVHKVWGLSKRFYLPVIAANGTLHFVHVDKATSLHKNKFGILEPPPSCQSVHVNQLEVILCPLVAFDLHGHRLGMGAGFYDKTLASVRGNPKPLLVGLAYDFQELRFVPHSGRDIPLHHCVTPTRILSF